MDTSGTPGTLNGTATTTVARIDFVHPLSGRRTFVKKLSVRNIGATNALRIYIPGNDVAGVLNFVTVPANSFTDISGPLTWIAVAAAAATTGYEIVANFA